MRSHGARIVKWSALGVVVVCAVAAVVFASRFGSDPSLSASPLIGRPLPSMSLVSLDDGSMIDIASLDSDVTVINFFASWCLQCRNEHRDLVATSDAYADKSVQFIGVTFQDRPVDAEGFLDELGRSAATLYLTDPNSQAAIALGLRGVPETYFVDRDGIIQGRIQGETNAILLSETIDTMLAGGSPGVQVVGEVQSEPG